MKWTFPNLRLFLFLAVITGGIYPLAVTLVSLIFFPSSGVWFPNPE